MRILRFARGAGVASLLFAGAAGAAECSGTDLLDTLRAEDPAKHRLVMEAAETFGPNGRLFRVTSPDGAVSHLFGTAHLADARITTLPEAVGKAFAEATTLVVELSDMDPVKMLAGLGDASRHLIARPGESLAARLGPEEAALAREALGARGQPHNVLDVLRPWAVTAILSSSVCMARLAGARPAQDKLLIGDARKAGKAVVGLETVVEQVAVLDSVDLAGQVRLARRAIARLDRVDDQVETLVRSYLRGEDGVVLAIARVDRESGADLTPGLIEALVDRRNARMIERMLPLVRKGGAFVAVGAMHLRGQAGVVQTLERLGFSIERAL